MQQADSTYFEQASDEGQKVNQSLIRLHRFQATLILCQQTIMSYERACKHRPGTLAARTPTRAALVALRLRFHRGVGGVSTRLYCFRRYRVDQGRGLPMALVKAPRP